MEMRQTHDEITQNLAERSCWEVARQDDARVTRRLLDIERLKVEHGAGAQATKATDL